MPQAVNRSIFKFRKHSDIGTLDAESDQFLEASFVNKDEYQLVRDTDSHKCILLGRTGSGKSAIIRHLEESNSFVVRIPPESISLRHLSNSDIIKYFNELGIKLDLFYKLLWKHVFIVEIVKAILEQNQNKTNNPIDWIKSKLPDKRKKRAIDYLQKWERHFWEDTEYRVKELEASLEKRFKEELNIQIPLAEFLNMKGLSEGEIKSIERVKIDVETKAKKVVNESQIEEIDALFGVLKDHLLPSMNKDIYLVIDDLDREWVSNEIVYDLIRSLIDTVREFRQLRRIKIVAALRSNVHDIVFAQNTSRGVQREKFSHLYLNIQWSEAELAELLDRRLSTLMKAQYTKAVPTHVDILPLANKRKESGLKYMLERSFMRPRDVIDFFNKCINRAEGKTKITREIIYAAEHEYSKARLQAVHDEWLENYGNIDCLFELVFDVDHRFIYNEIKQNAQTTLVNILIRGKQVELNDYLKAKFSTFGETFNVDSILPDILLILFNIGILGIKPTPDSKIMYSYKDDIQLSPEMIKGDVNFFVHPMFHRALRIHSVASNWLKNDELDLA